MSAFPLAVQCEDTALGVKPHETRFQLVDPLLVHEHVDVSCVLDIRKEACQFLLHAGQVRLRVADRFSPALTPENIIGAGADEIPELLHPLDVVAYHPIIFCLSPIGRSKMDWPPSPLHCYVEKGCFYRLWIQASVNLSALKKKEASEIIGKVLGGGEAPSSP